MKRLFLYAVLMVMGLLCFPGCASSPAPAPTPGEGETLIHLERRGDSGIDYPAFSVYLDGTEIAAIKGGEKRAFVVKQGEHALYIQFDYKSNESFQSNEITFEAGTAPVSFSTYLVSGAALAGSKRFQVRLFQKPQGK